MAIDLAKLSLWLATLAKDHEFTFIDHALRFGDSLLGLTRRQIEGLDWAAEKAGYQVKVGAEVLRSQISKATELHLLIREAGAETPEHELQDVHTEARGATEYARRLGDLTLAAFFKGTGQKARKALLAKLTDATQHGEATHYDSWLGEVNGGEHPFRPFHWDVEFPEVFDREKPGFDAIVGNPPFAGKNTVAAGNIERYPDWLKEVHEDSHGNADLVAHFFRRAFNLLRDGGTFGLIATNTIAQGDTRATGLRWICNSGGEIYCAVKRRTWPGLAAVVVSVIHVHKGNYAGTRVLNAEETDRITAFLLTRGDHDDPDQLRANDGKSYIGSYVLGMGFTFDDTDKKGVATAEHEMHRLLSNDPRNGEAIFPYIGGEEANTSPMQAHHRYVINFKEYPLRREDMGQLWKEAQQEQRNEWLRRGIVPTDYTDPVAADWPELLAIVEERVKPERAKLGNKADARRRKEKWWLWGRYTPGLFGAIDGMERVLAISRVGQQAAFAFQPSGMVYAESLVVFPFNSCAAFCVLQSRLHEVWARFLGSSMKDDLRYTPSDCFETYPFPDGWESRADLEAEGRTYYDARAQLMIENNEGLTKTYNRFHDPEDLDPRIATLRELHARMDGAVLRAYGWNDLPEIECQFIPDYEVDEDESGRKKKPWRYRWPDDVRDEIVMRLLALNRQRAEEERLAGQRTAGATASRKVSR